MSLDQLVHLAEAPTLGDGPPAERELGFVVDLEREFPPRLAELPLVLCGGVFDRAQASHPRSRPAERANPGVGIGAEVADASPQRLAADRALEQVLLDRLALAAIARRLGLHCALGHDLIQLARIHPPIVCRRMAEVEGQVVNEELDAERAARRRLALAQIRQYPDAALRLSARPVERFDDELRALVERMKPLMHDAVGVGLAATQVGVLKRLFVCTIEEGRDVAIVNPEIVERSEETDVADEGCLSLQGVLVPVERSAAVTIAGKDERGKDVRYELDEMAARVVQHELDHLDGVLIIDRTTPEARREAMAALRPRIVLA